MSHHDDHLHDAELGPVIARLQAERPTASDLELGLIKQRVRGRVAPSARRSRRTEFMRSRLAIIAMLVFGMVLSTGGGALAVSGFTSQQDNAAQGQYGPGTTTASTARTSGGDVLGEDESGNPAPRRTAARPATEDRAPSPPARSRPAPRAPAASSCRSPASRPSRSCSAASRC